ncbi:hypothetical protein Noda2021_06470 [Candidatus Dependentiae bacterium Noda2021]|nr:hypothetical protein Noda2021_06470 [Candidatus Dependentiae bacterium Noda2021]
MNIITSLKASIFASLILLTAVSRCDVPAQSPQHPAYVEQSKPLPVRVYRTTCHVAETLVKTVNKHSFLAAYLATVYVMNKYAFENPVFSFIYGLGGALLVGPAVKATTDALLPAPYQVA